MKHMFTYQFLKKDGIDPQLFSLSNALVDLKARSEESKKRNQAIFAKRETIAIVESVREAMRLRTSSRRKTALRKSSPTLRP